METGKLLVNVEVAQASRFACQAPGCGRSLKGWRSLGRHFASGNSRTALACHPGLAVGREGRTTLVLLRRYNPRGMIGPLLVIRVPEGRTDK